MTEQCLETNCNPSAHNVLTQRFFTWSQRRIDSISHWLSERRQHRMNRKAVKSLAVLDEKTLKDIGLTRGDVTWASNLPDSVSAATELEIIARRRPMRDR